MSIGSKDGYTLIAGKVEMNDVATLLFYMETIIL